jgi:hypothetical protein
MTPDSSLLTGQPAWDSVRLPRLFATQLAYAMKELSSKEAKAIFNSPKKVDPALCLPGQKGYGVGFTQTWSKEMDAHLRQTSVRLKAYHDQFLIEHPGHTLPPPVYDVDIVLKQLATTTARNLDTCSDVRGMAPRAMEVLLAFCRAMLFQKWELGLRPIFHFLFAMEKLFINLWQEHHPDDAQSVPQLFWCFDTFLKDKVKDDNRRVPGYNQQEEVLRQKYNDVRSKGVAQVTAMKSLFKRSLAYTEDKEEHMDENAMELLSKSMLVSLGLSWVLEVNTNPRFR